MFIVVRCIERDMNILGKYNDFEDAVEKMEEDFEIVLKDYLDDEEFAEAQENDFYGDDYQIHKNAGIAWANLREDYDWQIFEI